MRDPGSGAHGRSACAPVADVALALDALGKHRSVCLLRSLHRDSVATLQACARPTLEDSRAVGDDGEAVDAERHRRAGPLQAPKRAFNLELASGRLVVDLDLA